MKQKNAFFILAAALFISSQALSAVTLLDQNEWKFLVSGFLETDMTSDSVRSFTEVMGNNPVDRSNTFAGSNGRTQFSVRNSRLAFTVLPPVQDDWKSKGYFEFDFLGYDPAPPTNSEASFATNPTLRMRHGYLNLEKNGWSIFAGQTWSLFGWEPSYVVTTVSVPPAPGIIYQRTPELMVIQKIALSESENLQWGGAIARPSQRDSQTPNLDFGARLTSSRRSSGFASASGDVSNEAMSLALTGTRRDFTTPDSAAVTSAQTHHVGNALAVDFLFPLIASHDGAIENTLTWTGEYSTGDGYGDAFPSWTGNLAALPAAGLGVSNETNLDAGQGGFDASGDFHLVKLQTWNTQLQYHLPSSWHAFVTVGYTELRSNNAKDLSPIVATKTIYDQSHLTFLNIFHDCTKQIRVGLEYAEMSTHYIDDVQPIDHRYQISTFFRF